MMAELLDTFGTLSTPEAPLLCLRKSSAHMPPVSQSLSAPLVKEADDLASDVLPPRLLVVHDAGGSGEDDVAELTRWQKVDDPLLHVAELDVEARADDTGLVDAGRYVSSCRVSESWKTSNSPAVELDNNLAVAVIINLLELADVACGDKNVSEMSREI